MLDMRTEAEIRELHDECEEFLDKLRGKGLKFGGVLRDTALISSTLKWVLGENDTPDAEESNAVAPDTRLQVVPGKQSGTGSVGGPHCRRCAEVGHVAAHPELGCADVGCNASHEPGVTLYAYQRTEDGDVLSGTPDALAHVVSYHSAPDMLGLHLRAKHQAVWKEQELRCRPPEILRRAHAGIHRVTVGER